MIYSIGIVVGLVLALAAGPNPPDRTKSLMHELRDSRSTHVMVAAHRGDWMNHPENSLAAIDSAIKMGCEIIEIDLRMTKDGVFVLMHDKTVDRTSNGVGKVDHLTYAELAALRLRDRHGGLTDHPIPTLEQAINLARGRALLYLDKTEDMLPQLHLELVRLDAKGFCLTYGRHPAEELLAKHQPYITGINYLPKVGDATATPDQYIAALRKALDPPVFLVDFKSPDSPIVGQMRNLSSGGVRVWASPLWDDIAGGKTDDKAMTDPDGNWGWLVNHGASILCTDRPAELIAYLQKIGRRDQPSLHDAAAR